MGVTSTYTMPESLAERARSTLLKAQVLCREVESRIAEVKDRLSQWEKNRHTLRFLVSCLEHQLGFLEQCALRQGIGRALIETEWSQVVLVDLVNEMKLWYDKIQLRLERLDQVENILVADNKHLSHYISQEQALVLKKRLDEVPIIRPQIENIQTQYDTMCKRVRQKLINKRLTEIKTIFDSQFGDELTETAELTEVKPRDLDSIELELVDYINSLTDHFDKCQALEKGLFNDSNEYDELLKIVSADDSQLDDIMKHLLNTIDSTNHQIDKVYEILDIKTKQKTILHGKINELIANCTKYSEYLAIFKGIATSIEKFKEGCMQDIQLTKELYKFYDEFDNSYNKLLQEVQRRRALSQKMLGIIKNCENELKTLHDEDQKLRTHFLSENGAFLPETIWPGEIDDLSPLYALDYHIKEI